MTPLGGIMTRKATREESLKRLTKNVTFSFLIIVLPVDQETLRALIISIS